MTSTSFNVGLGSASRNSSKVLKPPGGGSSDIFGSTHDPEPQRKVKNHLTSSIFGGEDSQTPARKAGNDSFYNLFGAEPQSQSRPGTAVKDKFKSNIVLANTEPDAKKSLAFVEEACKMETEGGRVVKEVETENGPETNGVHKLEIVETNGVHKNGLEEEEREEVTTNGEKAETAVNGSSSASSTASTPASAPTAPAAAPAASATAPAASRPQRVPPGGFSSGLW